MSIAAVVKRVSPFGLSEKQIKFWEKEVRKFRESWCLAELNLECARGALEDTRNRMADKEAELKELQAKYAELIDEYNQLEAAYTESERVRKKLYYENVALRRHVEGRDAEEKTA